MPPDRGWPRLADLVYGKVRVMTIRPWAALLAAAAWTGGAAAAPVRFAGEGVVTRSGGSLPATGSAVVGDAVRFGFTFDPDVATPDFVTPDFASYSVPFTNFSASLGGYSFSPSDPTAQLGIGRGFSFFGGPSSESSRSFTFSFRGVPGAGAPFAGAASEQFQVSARFRDADPARPVSLSDLRDPAEAAARRVGYLGAASGMPPNFSFLDGTYQGGFAAVAAVPEPGTWALMIAGVGAVGGALRRRRTGEAMLAA